MIITNDNTQSRFALDRERLDTHNLAGIKEEWSELAGDAASCSIFTTFDWLQAWAFAFRPRALQLIRITDRRSGDLIALGLVDIDRIRAWRFAGGFATPQRTLLCRAGYEQSAWFALADWLGRHRNAWSLIEAQQVPAAASALPNARISHFGVPRIAVPHSMDEYFAQLSSRRRSELRRRLRRGAEAGIEARLLPAGSVTDATSRFAALYAARSTIIDRTPLDTHLPVLIRGLVDVLPSAIRAHELSCGDECIAISISLIFGKVYCAWLQAWAPARASLAPGILVALSAVQDAIETRAEIIDLGPGEQPYKHSLGGRPTEYSSVQAISGGLVPKALSLAGSIYGRLRADA